MMQSIYKKAVRLDPMRRDFENRNGACLNAREHRKCRNRKQMAGPTSFYGLLLLLAALTVVFMAAPCEASVMRGEVLLDRETITLGDVFGDVGEASSKSIGSAPAPGRKITYDVTALSQIARSFGVAWQPQSNYDHVTITRASQVINAAMVKERLAANLAASGAPKDLDIALDNQGLEIHRPTGETAEWRLVDLTYDPVQRRFKGSLVVGAGSDADVTAITGRAMPMVEVALLAHPVALGNPFRESDVEWMRVPLDKAGADAITSAAQLTGMEARRNIEEKTVLRIRDLAKARLVTKGSMVTMVVNTQAMHITAQGRALSDGVIGETLRIMNTQSNRTVDAIVTGPAQVSVSPGNGDHVALAN